MAKSKHVAKRISDIEVEYRSYVIRRRDEVPTGYYGRYTIGVSGPGFSTLRDAKAYIDKKFT